MAISKYSVKYSQEQENCHYRLFLPHQPFSVIAFTSYRQVFIVYQKPNANVIFFLTNNKCLVKSHFTNPALTNRYSPKENFVCDIHKTHIIMKLSSASKMYNLSKNLRDIVEPEHCLSFVSKSKETRVSIMSPQLK
jgi:hypothetical protein